MVGNAIASLVLAVARVCYQLAPVAIAYRYRVAAKGLGCGLSSLSVARQDLWGPAIVRSVATGFAAPVPVLARVARYCVVLVVPALRGRQPRAVAATGHSRPVGQVFVECVVRCAVGGYIQPNDEDQHGC